MYTLMIVDDKKVIVDGLKIIISRMLPECRVVAAAYDAEKGLLLGTELQPEIIVTDIKMIGEDGLSMIEKLQQAGCTAHFVILSAYPDFRYAQKGMRLGVRYYLTKPVEELELQQCIRHIIKDINEKKQAESNKTDTVSGIVEDAHEKDLILKVRRYLTDNFQKNISLKELSEKFYINLFYLSQLFKKKTGQNYSDYLACLRIDRAKELLIKTDMRVYEICEAVGYTDATYFSKLFEKICGCTPSEYRKSRSLT
ncbi:MAG: helix-turn-helix domain-containing protein [Spirochaetaceae bacterium]|jgi:YesN/AraC family two-component response regulator|nr:helix-turn-helix domain-containing protein [Spirochaetaceae bacterium]